MTRGSGLPAMQAATGAPMYPARPEGDDALAETTSPAPDLGLASGAHLIEMSSRSHRIAERPISPQAMTSRALQLENNSIYSPLGYEGVAQFCQPPQPHAGPA
jgi:hypothetical protein